MWVGRLFNRYPVLLRLCSYKLVRLMAAICTYLVHLLTQLFNQCGIVDQFNGFAFRGLCGNGGQTRGVAKRRNFLAVGDKRTADATMRSIKETFFRLID